MFNLMLPTGSPTQTTPSLSAAYYLLFYINISLTLYLSAIWLIITTAFFRFLLVQYPIPAVKWCTQRKSVAAGIMTILGSLLCSVPNFLMHTVGDARSIPADPQRVCFFYSNPNVDYYGIVRSEYAYRVTWSPVFNHWFFTTIGKFIPCILLAIFTAFLIKVLKEAEKRHRRLHGSSRRQSTSKSGSKKSNSAIQSKTSDYKQTTRMLLAVVVLFFTVELSHGILIVWASATHQLNVYDLLGDLVDMLTLVTFFINFILYSAMSQQYRTLFTALLMKPFSTGHRYRYNKGNRYSRRLTLASCQTEQVVLHSESHHLNESEFVESQALNSNQVSKEKDTLITEQPEKQI